MTMEQRARILEIAKTSSCGVREIVHLLRSKTSNVVILLKKMEDEQLIQKSLSKTHRKGRPKKYVGPTALGCEFLDTYNKLKMKPLRARKEDLAHAAKEARYANRLVENGHLPFQIFLELNTVASNIKDSSENH